MAGKKMQTYLVALQLLLVLSLISLGYAEEHNNTNTTTTTNPSDLVAETNNDNEDNNT